MHGLNLQKRKFVLYVYVHTCIITNKQTDRQTGRCMNLVWGVWISKILKTTTNKTKRPKNTFARSLVSWKMLFLSKTKCLNALAMM